MRKRLGVLILLAAALAAGAIWLHLRTTRETSASVEKTPDPMRDEDPVRLAPDRRAQLAIPEVERLLTGRSGKAATFRFDGGCWHVLVDSRELGTLPEYPDLSDFMTVLVARATALLKSAPPAPVAAHPAVERALEQFEPLTALLAADREWSQGHRDAALHAGAARALVQLVTETNDLVGAADRTAARALAELAICHAMNVTGLDRDEALLAERMGYGARATEIAARLPADDPIALFIRRDDAALTGVAAAEPPRPEARFLELTRLVASRDEQACEAWLERAFRSDTTVRLPTLTALLSLERFSAHEPSAEAVLLAIESDLKLNDLANAGARMSEGSDLSVVFRRFEASMSAMRASADGEWLDRDLARAYYRAGFYSALWRLGRFSREELSSVGDTRALATAWSGMPADPAEEFGRWYRHLAEAKAGHPAPLDLESDLISLPSFGSQLRFDTFHACAETRIGRQNGVRRQARMLIGQLDTRPGDRLRLADIVQTQIWDLVWAESLYASAARCASPGDPSAQGAWAYMNGDEARVKALLAAPGLNDVGAIRLLFYLEHMAPEDVDATCAVYEAAAARFPRSAPIVCQLAAYARTKGKPPAYARQALRGWMARNPGEDGLDRVAVTTAIARTLEREHRYREALAWARPTATSWQFGAMHATAELLDECGHGAEAETLAAMALGRYPDSHEALVGLVGMLWRHQRYEDAARLLRQAPYRLDDVHWFTLVGPEFADRFAARPYAAMRAVEALEHAGFTSQNTMGSLATVLHRRGNDDLALRIERHVQGGGQDGMEKLMASIFYVSVLKGPAAARAYALQSTAGASDDVIIPLGDLALGEGRYDLLWAFEPQDRAANSCHWLLRSAAALYPGPETVPHEEALRAHFAVAGTEHYHVLGRYLMGFVPEDTVMALRTSMHAACEVYYYVGFRAQAEGRFADAARLYKRCIATGQSRNIEYAWAVSQLSRWMDSGMTLERLAARARASNARPSTTVLGLTAAAANE